MSSPSLAQHVFGLIGTPSITISTSAMLFQSYSHKALPPYLIKVVTFNMNDKIVQDDAYVRPHDDDHVAFGVDELDSDFLKGLESPL